MPRYPNLDSYVSRPSTSSYSALASEVYGRGGPVYPLHIGDTWLEPAARCRMQSITVEDHPGMHRYSPVSGRGSLRKAIADRTRQTGDHPAEPGEVLVTAGATGGLFAVAATLLSPGDEVVVVAPYWPLIGNAIECAGAKTVPVPFFERSHDEATVIETLTSALSERTVAIYWNTPHNPTGRIIPPSWLEVMANWARAHDLWIIADEVYEHYAYAGAHQYSRPFAPERTVSAYSFSKAYGMAGNRCGYLVGPAPIVSAIQRITRNSFYSVCSASQIAAERALQGDGDAWAADAAAQYLSLGRYAAQRLGAPEPEGSTFLFLDVSAGLDDRGVNGFLKDCADQGLLVAPGSSFGPYHQHVRVCFTCAPPDVVRDGIDILAAQMGVNGLV